MGLLGKILAAIALLMVGFVLFDRIEASSTRTFCSGLPKGATLAEVKSLSDSAGFFFLGAGDGGTSAFVLNHRAWFFRYSCDIRLRDGRLESTQVISAD